MGISGGGDTAPSITTQPQSQTIPSGSTATLSVAASGTTPLSYQWYQGSTGDASNPISGATSASYTTPALTATTSYWVRVSNSAGQADSSTATVTVNATPCAAPDTTIGAIQGTGATFALGGTQTVQGVVVGDYEYSGSGATSDSMRGFYIQNTPDNDDDNAATSDGMFVFNNSNDSVSVGQVVQVTGNVSEFYSNGQGSSQTQITAQTIEACGTGTVSPTDVSLPLTSATELERYEGMLVRFPQTLYVTEHFQLGRFGQVLLSSGGRLKQPTNVTTPGASALAQQAANDLNQIIVDDDTQAQNPDPIAFGRGGNPLSASNTLRGGDTISDLVGVLSYSDATTASNVTDATDPYAYRVRPLRALNGGAPNFQAANTRPSSAPNVGGTLRVTAANLLNYFNTFGSTACTYGVGGGSTDCRGADSAAEFSRQWPKTVAALTGNGADVIAVMELENDGYGASSAIQDLVTKLNNAAGAGTYAFIDADAATGQTNALGTDAIKVAIIYKPGKVTPVGTTAALNSTAFVNGGDSAQRNRPALAQAFEQNSNGARFIVVANHLKSKGSACDAPDAGDGQGNCNTVRTNAANTLMTWLGTNPTGTGDPDVLIVGDLNSYAKEDPITAIKNAGYTNLIEANLGADAYSYVFDGQWGYLDHALGSASLTSQVAGVGDWHINADEPSVLDYNTEFKTTSQISSLYSADEFRVSDHDPVIIGLNLTAPAATAPGITTQPSSQTIQSGETATLNVVATGTAPLAYQWYQGTSGDTASPISGATSASYTTPALSATTSYWVRVSNSAGTADSNTATVTVQQAATAPSITTQPQSQSITSGQTATLNVVASGTAPLSYQWYVGTSGDTASPISGATSASYTTPALSATTSYWVRVSNSAGQVDSSTATVTVTPAAGASVVISQVFGGGGNSGATLKNDFIELYNRSSSPVSLNGWSVQYASAANAFSGKTDLSGTIQPGQYFLIQEAAGTGGTTSLPTPDATGTIAMGGTAGKVALVNTQTLLTCGASTNNCFPNSAIIDFVGYGTTANNYEGTGPAPAPSSTNADVRADNGATDTNNNAADFTAATANPRNSTFGQSSNPSGTGTANPSTIQAGGQTTLTVVVTPGTNPTSTGTTVTADLSSIGGSATQTFFDDGTNGDTTANDNTFSFNATVSSGTAAGPKSLPFTIADAQNRTGSGTIALTVTAVDPCSTTYTHIYSIQGSGTSAAITGSVTTQGVVVGDFEGSASASGFYLQDLTGDGDAATSDGIFVFTGNADTVSVGQVVRVTGYARERFNQTALNASNSNTDPVLAANILACGTGSVAATDVILPFASATDPERYEGMLVRFPEPLVIAEYFNYDRFGEIVLAKPLNGESRPFTGTAIDAPGAAANARTAANALSRITLDDAQSAQNPPVLRHPNGQPFSLSNRFRGGDTVQNAIGVLGFDFSLYRIFPTAPADYTAVNTRPAAPEEVGGTIRVAAMNTLNFFLTGDAIQDDTTNNPADDVCGGNTNLDCRGWDVGQSTELDRQRDKLLQALSGLDADIIGLNELENTPGVNPLESITSGMPGYAYIDTGTIGTDAIKVGIIYRSAVVTPVGPYKLLTTAVDSRFLDTKNRPSMAQTFEVNATGARFTMVVNHFKSKGSACTDVGDPDLGDGQGNCSQTRRAAAEALVDWLATDPTGSGDPDFLIMGDLNSYAKEQTLTEIQAGADDAAGTSDDFTNLIAQYKGAYAYSYTFDGQAGYLDHALANASLLSQVTGAADWHINSDEPDVLDYDTSFKPAEQEALYEVNAYRTSDHDPVVVGLNLTKENIAPSAASRNATVAEDSTTALTISASDPDNDALTFSIVTGPANGTLGAITQNGCTGSICTATVNYTPNADYSGSDTFTFKVNDGTADSNTATVTITVNPVNDAPVANNDSYTTAEDTTLSVPAPGLLANDTDVDSTSLSVALVSAPANGSVALNANGSFIFTPASNFNGTTSFTYRANDGAATSNVATVTITVTSVNDVPMANNDTLTVFEDANATVVNVLANDSDVDGDTLSVTGVTQGSKGTVTLNAGTVSYKPNLNANGSDSFTYTISDGQGGTATGTVNVTITPVNDPPVANPDTATVKKKSSVVIAVLANDSDVDTNDTITLVGVTQGTKGGTATKNANGTVTFKPKNGFTGTDTFTYTIRDSQGVTATGTVTVTVTK